MFAPGFSLDDPTPGSSPCSSDLKVLASGRDGDDSSASRKPRFALPSSVKLVDSVGMTSMRFPPVTGSGNREI